MINQDTDIGVELFSRKDKLLLACSGGADSVCLFHLLQQQGYHFAVAHVNYHLRGEESEKDEAFIRDLCEEFKIDCYVKSAKLKAENKKSIQSAARKVRYDFFEDLINEFSIDYLLTAHHEGDLVENAFFRFARGTGLRGLQSFSVIREKMLRPLLGFTKADIEAYLKQENFAYRIDASNQSIKYTRNKIRNTILPLLEEDLKNVNKRIVRTTELLKADYQLIQTFVAPYLQELLDAGKVKWDCKNIVFGKPAFWFHLFENISEDQCKQIANACITSKNGFAIKVDGYVVFIIQNRLGISLEDDSELITFQINEPKEGEIELNAKTEIKFDFIAASDVEFNENLLFLAGDELSFPLLIRHPQKGDKFNPLGMKGNKLLSDFYNDLKIPAEQKKKEWVLTDKKGEIIALLPHRISEKFKVVDQTKLVLCISVA